jgi:hypothetical protein
MAKLTLRELKRRAAVAAPDHLDRLLASASESDRRIVDEASQLSMTGPARLLALIDAVRYCANRELAGAFVECGVWRGGSVLAIIRTLQDLGVADRDVYLYDTFEGMTEPTEADVSVMDPPALKIWGHARSGKRVAWPEVFAPELVNEEAVRSLISGTGYPSEHVRFVKGPVEQTIPGSAPEEISLLRLDTDWYESTRHELTHLFPRLLPGGVLIIDDYGHWRGAQKAVDEYFSEIHSPLLLNRIDYTGRIAVKA